MTSFTKDDRRYEYSYNSDGMRTVKKVYENNELVYTYTYIWDGDVLLAGRMEVTDADVPLDSESNVELNIEYDAWGKPIFEESSLGASFVKAMIMAATNVGYRGYFYDFETGLYYLRSRYYAPETGRFINADDTDYLGIDSSPISLNLFIYCENNPINSSDKSGYWSQAVTTITVNFYNIYTSHPHCDIAYDGSTISYGSDNGKGPAKLIDKINGTQGYILYKEADRSYDAYDFRTIKVKVYYDKFVNFFVREINKTHYIGPRWKDGAKYPSIVYEPHFSRVKWRSSKYYKYKLDKVTCVTFAADWLYYCMYLPSKMKLKNNGKDMQKFTLPIQLYNYLKPLR